MKEKALKNVNLTIVAPSIWLSQSAKESTLFKQFPNYCIPYGLDFGTMPEEDYLKVINRSDDQASFVYYEMRLEDALQDLTQSYTINFSYSSDFIPVDDRVTAEVKNEPLGEFHSSNTPFSSSVTFSITSFLRWISSRCNRTDMLFRLAKSSIR